MTYTQRHLPHWQPEGVAIFLTWRQAGSLPAPKPGSFVTVDRDLDRAASGPRRLEDPRIAQCIMDAIHYGETEMQLYRLRAWALMTNHVHLLIHPQAKLPRITKAIKNFSARQANAIPGRTGQRFWQDESYDHWVRGPRELEKIVRYIERNPVTAGLAATPNQWPWSSASVGQASRPVVASN